MVKFCIYPENTPFFFFTSALYPPIIPPINTNYQHYCRRGKPRFNYMCNRMKLFGLVNGRQAYLRDRGRL